MVKGYHCSRKFAKSRCKTDSFRWINPREGVRILICRQKGSKKSRAYEVCIK